jgi:hypothetical protein
MILALVFQNKARIRTDLHLFLRPRVSKISSDFFETKPYPGLFYMLMMNLCFKSKNKR